MSGRKQEPGASAPLAEIAGAGASAPSVSAWKDPVLWTLLVLATGLLFFSLGDRPLWQDEAETALLGRGILRTGLPVAKNGNNVVSQLIGEEYGSDYVWRWSPWVQFYIAAGSMGLLGPTTFAARVPFAVLGVLAVAFTYMLARRLFGPPGIARLSALLLVLSVPFLLHVRQARWCAAAYLLVVLVLLSLSRLMNRQRFGGAGFVAAGLLLFHTNYFVAIGFLASTALAAALYVPQKAFLGRLGLAYAGLVLLTLPGALYFDVLGKPHHFSSAHLWALLQLYTGYLATYMVPLPVLAILLGLLFQRRPVFSLPPDWKRSAGFLLTLTVLYLGYLMVGPWGIFRYLTILLPVTAILTAVVVYWILSLSVRIGVLILVVLVATDVVHQLPLGYLRTPGTVGSDEYATLGAVRFPLYGYLYEISHHVDDADGVVAQYLCRHAKPGDVVLATYGDLPLQFYTDLHVVGGYQGQPLPAEPDWIFLRQFYVGKPDVDVSVFITQHIDLTRYQPAPLSGVDCKFSNSPDPTYHLFRLPKKAPPILLFHKEGRS
jgi:hypothetical protein